MQKQNPVIKNYILSSEKYVLKDDTYNFSFKTCINYKQSVISDNICMWHFLNDIQKKSLFVKKK